MNCYITKLCYTAICIMGISVVLVACSKDTSESENNQFVFTHEGLPDPNLPDDNILTKEGVALGRMLFYETALSKDNSISCASCHAQKNAFSDTNRFSIGVRQLPGKRQAMAIFNMAWNDNNFFWDGRAELLRHQSLMPIEDPLEMDETLVDVIEKLAQDQQYVDAFETVFPGEAISSHTMSLALEQFMHSIVSNQSKYDKFLRGEVALTAKEEKGRRLFFAPINTIDPTQSGANCVSCHGGPNFENNEYMNNGLDTDAAITDIGRENVTGSAIQRATFKVTSLRNIALTPPYMHDGRFETLEEVIEHYNNGIKASATVSPTLISVQHSGGLQLTSEDKEALIAFLHTLSDIELINNKAYSDPFE